jgi:nucleoside-diphosphate-sugar epimerase
MKIAVLGAGGFVGSRYIEHSVLSQSAHQFTPIVRSPRGLARLCKLGINPRLLDSSNPNDLTQALLNHDVVLNLAIGKPDAILDDARQVYQSCLNARVKSLICISSAVVFGRVWSPDINDDSPPNTNSWMLYARQKARVENFFRDHFAGSLPVTVLRPGLIWGPRSPWSLLPAQGLSTGTAYLAGGGQGVCNLIHLDNLIRCINRVISTSPSRSGFYNVKDPENLTWFTYYMAIADSLGYSHSRIFCTNSGLNRRTPSAIMSSLQQSRLFATPLSSLIKKASPEFKGWIKQRLFGQQEEALPPLSPSEIVCPAKNPVLPRDLWELHNTKHPLSLVKFISEFGDPGLLPFQQHLELTCQWLRFVGYGA